MSEKTQVEAYLYSMEEGQVTAIEYNGEIFVRAKKPTVAKPVPTKQELPDGSVGFCKNYGVHIQKEDFDAVKKAIEKDGHATSKTIVKETGMTIEKTRAILRFMKDNSYVKPIFRKNKVFYLIIA